MANEFKHKTVGAILTQSEFEDILLHVLDGQVAGDIVVALSDTQIGRSYHRSNLGVDSNHHWFRIGGTDDTSVGMFGFEDLATQITSVTKARAATALSTGKDAASELRGEAWDGAASAYLIARMLMHITALNEGDWIWEFPLLTERFKLSHDGRLSLTGCKLNLGAGSELTISSGAITLTHSYHAIDTESDAASDDLTTINGGAIGDIVILRAIHSDRTVVVKNGATIFLAGGADFSLDHYADILKLIQIDTGVWAEVSRSNNA